MKIGELWQDDDRPVLDGDWVRGILVLGRVSKNPADTDGAIKGKSSVTRKFNKICESESLFIKFDKAPAHIGPHKFDGSYTDDDLMGTWHNPVSTTKGLRMDILCRKIGEAYHPQASALRDHIEHNRPFGGFSPLFDGDTDMVSGEVQTVDSVAGIDWVPLAGSVRSIVESEAAETFESRHAEHKKRLDDHETRIAECEARMGKQIAEAVAAEVKKLSEIEAATKSKVAEAAAEVVSVSSGARTVPPPAVKTVQADRIDPFQFIRSK